MTNQLELFASNTESFCKYPRLKRSSAYAYGCRCDLCGTWHREYDKRYIKEKRQSVLCQLCSKEPTGYSIYPVCHKCCTAFIKRTRFIKIPWSQVFAWIERSSCRICHCYLNMQGAGGPGSWQIDHDHQKGRRADDNNYRDVLCGPCNSGIGALEANIRRGLITKVKGPFGDYLAIHQATSPTSDT